MTQSTSVDLYIFLSHSSGATHLKYIIIRFHVMRLHLNEKEFVNARLNETTM